MRDQNLSPHVVKKGTEHKYGNDAGLCSAVEDCMKFIGWEINPGLEAVYTIFDVPKKKETASTFDMKTPLTLGDTFTEFRERNELVEFWGRSLESFFAESKFHDGFATMKAELKPLPDSHRASRGSLFTTAGGYVGANICRLRPGDEIYLLFGCRMPVVLRKVEGGHQLVGPVYICGAMDGTVMDQLESLGTVTKDVLNV
ncbi:Nn.00g083860.m01.CDS01 [Neocucurbitaria sp. VM-36]